MISGHPHIAHFLRGAAHLFGLAAGGTFLFFGPLIHATTGIDYILGEAEGLGLAILGGLIALSAWIAADHIEQGNRRPSLAEALRQAQREEKDSKGEKTQVSFPWSGPEKKAPLN